MKSRLFVAIGLISVVSLFVLFELIGFLLTGDFRQRRAVLKPMLATNASLEVVRQRVGEFLIYRRGTEIWNDVLAKYERGSSWDKYIAQKMKAAAAMGHTSTIDMQTWIFLDDRDRLIGFEIGTQ